MTYYITVRHFRKSLLKTLSQINHNLFDVQSPAIVKHINNIYNDEELDKNSTYSILEQVRLEENRKVLRKKEYYNLDMNTKYVIYKLKCPHNLKRTF